MLRRSLLTGLSLLALSHAAHANGLNFVLVNDTGYDIAMVFLDPNASNVWTDDVMDDDILPDGSSVTINFVGEFDSCVWDLKVEWTEDYDATFWQGLNLCSISEVTLQYNPDTDVTSAELR